MYNCQYCNKECKNKNSLGNHETRCPHNPNRKKFVNGMLGKKGSNQYIKAKDLGLPKPEMSEETRAKISAAGIGRSPSDATKQILSEKRKKWLEENPDKIPYVVNHSSQKSYPETYFEECFAEIVSNKEIQYHVLRYQLDFANPSKKLYLEIDGEQHYVDKRIVEHDKKRTAKLAELGWHGIRIRWAEFKKLNPDEQKEVVNHCIEAMQWTTNNVHIA